MEYNFPTIRTIDDVLPHISGRSEFIIAERPFGKIINYAVAMSDTFDMKGPDDIGGAIRRELRGIIFDNKGNIISRPFHKFFNIGEREETMPYVLDFSRDHIITTKVDGSMLRPIEFDNKIRWATKMGITDVAEFAEKYIEKNSHFNDFASFCISQNLTPIFEYVGPFNKVVLDYEEGMILLAVRENISGKYLNIHEETQDYYILEMISRYNIPVVQVHSRFESAKALIEYTKPLIGVEGFVVDFNGHKLKVKADQYVMIHNIKELIREERNIAAIIVNEKLDDIIPFLDGPSLETIRAYEIRFCAALDNVLNRLESLVNLARVLHGGVKKEVAINFVQNLINKEDASFIFSALDGKELRPLVIKKIKDSVSNGQKYEKLMRWLEA
jgi:RNA ligase